MIEIETKVKVKIIRVPVKIKTGTVQVLRIKIKTGTVHTNPQIVIKNVTERRIKRNTAIKTRTNIEMKKSLQVRRLGIKTENIKVLMIRNTRAVRIKTKIGKIRIRREKGKKIGIEKGTSQNMVHRRIGTAAPKINTGIKINIIPVLKIKTRRIERKIRSLIKKRTNIMVIFFVFYVSLNFYL